MSTDYAGLAFNQAKGYTPGRPDGPPLWLVFHTMESGETATSAEGTANYFHNPPDGRQVSSHTCIDNDSAVQCVRVSDCAWCAGNRPGNRRGIHIELAGRAAQTSVQWADTFSAAQLALTARVHAIDVVRFAIPIRFLTVAQLRNRDKGFTTHNDLRLAFGVTTHWDPGAGFPREKVLDLFRVQVAKLTNVTPPAPKPTPGLVGYTLGSRTLKLTSPMMKGTDVLFVQRWLSWVTPDDGIFGPGTKAGVIRYQKMRGLTADGVVGPRTWAAMGVK